MHDSPSHMVLNKDSKSDQVSERSNRADQRLEVNSVRTLLRRLNAKPASKIRSQARWQVVLRIQVQVNFICYVTLELTFLLIHSFDHCLIALIVGLYGCSHLTQEGILSASGPWGRR